MGDGHISNMYAIVDGHIPCVIPSVIRVTIYIIIEGHAYNSSGGHISNDYARVRINIIGRACRGINFLWLWKDFSSAEGAAVMVVLNPRTKATNMEDVIARESANLIIGLKSLQANRAFCLLICFTSFASCQGLRLVDLLLAPA